MRCEGSSSSSGAVLVDVGGHASRVNLSPGQFSSAHLVFGLPLPLFSFSFPAVVMFSSPTLLIICPLDDGCHGFN